MHTPSGVPDEVPAFWLSLLHGRGLRRVGGQGRRSSAAARFGRAAQLEGVGRFAVVADPHGATFGVIAGEPPEE